MVETRRQDAALTDEATAASAAAPSSPTAAVLVQYASNAKPKPAAAAAAAALAASGSGVGGAAAAAADAARARGRGGGLTFDQALERHVGEFGRAQVLNFVLASLVWIPNAMLILMLVFAMGSPLRARAWECVGAGGGGGGGAGVDAACAAARSAPDPLQAGFCALPRGSWRWTDPSATLVAQFDLVCKDAWKAQTANSFFFVGYLVGSGLFGQLSDRCGRKPCLFGAAAASALFAALGAACGGAGYWPWLVVRALSGVGAAGTALCGYILATEPIGASWRGAAGIATQIFFIAGELALVAVAAAAPRSWRATAGAVAAANGIVLLLWPLLPESPRWLLVRGRKAEAEEVLAVFARRNGTSLPEGTLADVVAAAPLPPATAAAAADGALPTVSTVPQQQQPPLTLGTALRDWHIARRSLVLAYSWMVICMTYYGISFALSGVGGSLTASFIASAAAELPSYLAAAWAIDRCGRHNTMAACTLLGGVGCALCAAAPPGGARIALASFGKFGISAAFAVASIYTSELFPTLIRSAVLGAVNQAARVGGIVAPFIALAGARSDGSAGGAPFLIFGAASALAGLLVFTLPETLGAPLPDTLDDMGAIASIFTHKTLKTRGLKAAAASMFKARVRLPGGGKAGGGGEQGKSIWPEDEEAAGEVEEPLRADGGGAGSSGLIPAHRPPR